MAGKIGQVGGENSGNFLNAGLAEEEATLKQTEDNVESEIIQGDVPAASTKTNHVNVDVGGTVDGVNDVFTLPGAPDLTTIRGQLISSGVTQSLVEGIHFSHVGNKVTMDTPPPSLARPLFTFDETVNGIGKFLDDTGVQRNKTTIIALAIRTIMLDCLKVSHTACCNHPSRWSAGMLLCLTNEDKDNNAARKKMPVVCVLKS